MCVFLCVLLRIYSPLPGLPYGRVSTIFIDQKSIYNQNVFRAGDVLWHWFLSDSKYFEGLVCFLNKYIFNSINKRRRASWLEPEVAFAWYRNESIPVWHTYFIPYLLLWRFIHPGNLNAKWLNFSRMYLDCLGSFQSLLWSCSPRLWCCSRTWGLYVDVPRYHVVANGRQIVPSPVAVKWWVKCSYIDSLFNASLKPFWFHC